MYLGRFYSDYNDFCSDEYDDGHGNVVANVAAGLSNGVASKANIYGISILGEDIGNGYPYATTLVQGLEYINAKYLNETEPECVDKFIHKSVINMSGGYNLFSDDEKTLNTYFSYNSVILNKKNSKRNVINFNKDSIKSARSAKNNVTKIFPSIQGINNNINSSINTNNPSLFISNSLKQISSNPERYNKRFRF